jgi:hypothetical protein
MVRGHSEDRTMRYRHKAVTGRYIEGTFWYVVTLPDGRTERYLRAWQATARAEGWTPPPDPHHMIVEHTCDRAPNAAPTSYAACPACRDEGEDARGVEPARIRAAGRGRASARRAGR